MRHLSLFLNPQDHGLTPYRVTLTQCESHAIRSLRDEGVVYRHPEHTETVIVWAHDVGGIAAVLTYHYRHAWTNLHMLPTASEPLRVPKETTMADISGVVIWDATLPDDHGWLIFSEQLNEGGPTFPHPDYYDMPQDADADALKALVQATIFWERHARPTACLLARQGERWHFTATMAED